MNDVPCCISANTALQQAWLLLLKCPLTFPALQESHFQAFAADQEIWPWKLRFPCVQGSFGTENLLPFTQRSFGNSCISNSAPLGKVSCLGKSFMELLQNIYSTRTRGFSAKCCPCDLSSIQLMALSLQSCRKVSSCLDYSKSALLLLHDLHLYFPG